MPEFLSKFKSKRSQVTIFVIIAIVLVALILLFFSLNKKFNFLGRELSAKDSLENCIAKEINKIDSLILKQGGVLNPKHYLTYESSKVAFLCYTEEYAKPCINQQPLLKENIEKEILEASFSNISSCVYKEKTRMEGKGYSVVISNFSRENVIVKLLPGKILVELNSEMTISNSEKTEKISNFKSAVQSPAYEYSFLANKIINSEIENADFNQLAYMFLNRKIEIDKIRSNDYTLYKLQNRNDDKVFIFLIRNYPIPPGL